MKGMTRLTAAAATLALCACSAGAPARPAGLTWKYPQQRISEAQWQALRAETVALPGARTDETELTTKVTVAGPSQTLTDTVMYMFTTPQHAGHPAAAKITFPPGPKGPPVPDYAFHYAGNEEGFRAFARGVIIGASILASESAK
jgi:hypothetical protein